VKVPGTLYELLEDDLKAVYAARNRNLSHENRWIFCGSWLVLWAALQACPLNACYDIFGDPKESMTLLDILEHRFATIPSPPLHVNKMPAAPYEGGNVRIRNDSAVAADPSDEFAASKPAALELWYGILEAATNVWKVTSMAESLLVYACPEKNAMEVLETMDNPGKQLHNDDELRLRFRDLLFPSYSTLTAPSPSVNYTKRHVVVFCRYCPVRDFADG
jgi:hypothetical protein